MADHEWRGCLLLLCERQELGGKFPHHLTVERHKVCDPKTIEDREQQQWIVERLTKRFRLFDQEAPPLCCRFGFWRGVPFDMEEWGYEDSLKLDLLATQRRRVGQGLDLV